MDGHLGGGYGSAVPRRVRRPTDLRPPPYDPKNMKYDDIGKDWVFRARGGRWMKPGPPPPPPEGWEWLRDAAMRSMRWATNRS